MIGGMNEKKSDIEIRIWSHIPSPKNRHLDHRIGRSASLANLNSKSDMNAFFLINFSVQIDNPGKMKVIGKLTYRR